MQKEPQNSPINATKRTKTITTFNTETAKKAANLSNVARKSRTRTNKTNMIEALKKTRGIVIHAASLVGINRKTHQTWMRKDEKYRALVGIVEQDALDLAEEVVHLTMERQQNDPALALRAAQFYLENKGATRGYGKTQINIQNNQANVGSMNVLQELRRLQGDEKTSE